MKNLSYLIYIIFCISLSNNLFAQTPDTKKNKDFFIIKTPAIEYSAPNEDDVLFEDEFNDSTELAEKYQFVPEKEGNILNEDIDEEDTTFVDEEEGDDLHIVEVDEQINIDSFWVTIAQYYAIWDSRTINPYKIDGADFKDTMSVALYDSINGFNWSMPLDYSKVNSRFGFRRYRWHYGTDLDLNIGEPVRASFDGVIRIVKYDPKGYGKYILIRHFNGFETLYAHLSVQGVQVGQMVKAGEIIGRGGNTGRSSGPHLHFEVRYEGNAINPEFMYDFANHTLNARVFELSPKHFSYLKEARKVYYHTVRRGESLSVIARKYRVSVSTLCRLNRITTRSTLRVGQKLRIR